MNETIKQQFFAAYNELLAQVKAGNVEERELFKLGGEFNTLEANKAKVTIFEDRYNSHTYSQGRKLQFVNFLKKLASIFLSKIIGCILEKRRPRPPTINYLFSIVTLLRLTGKM